MDNLSGTNSIIEKLMYTPHAPADPGKCPNFDHVSPN